MQVQVQVDVVLHRNSPKSHSPFIDSCRARNNKEMQYKKSATARFKTNVSTTKGSLIMRRDKSCGSRGFNGETDD